MRSLSSLVCIIPLKIMLCSILTSNRLLLLLLRRCHWPAHKTCGRLEDLIIYLLSQSGISSGTGASSLFITKKFDSDPLKFSVASFGTLLSAIVCI
jgi:hypothetical protein